MTAISLPAQHTAQGPLYVRPLPLLPEVGADNLIADALQLALDLRIMTAVLGPKGQGKTFQLTIALAAHERQRAKARREGQTGVPGEVKMISSLREAGYMGALHALLHAIDKRQVEAMKRRVKPTMLLKQICQLIDTRKIAALVLDELEFADKHTLNAMRDVMAECQAIAAKRQAAGETSPCGVGILLIGASDADAKLRAFEEYGERLMRVLHVHPLTPVEVDDVLTAWLPTAAMLTGDDRKRFKTFARHTLCPNGATPSLRFLDSLVRQYARYMAADGRGASATAWTELPIDFEILVDAAQEQARSSGGTGPMSRG